MRRGPWTSAGIFSERGGPRLKPPGRTFFAMEFQKEFTHTAFGGFKREEVTSYLRQLEQDCTNEIDELNILHATMLAMQRAVAGLHIAPEYVLIDGNRCPKLPMPAMAVVKGDSRVPEISAASILAKVTRDAEMAALDIVFPQYGFAQHKGYPTAFHLEKLAEYGTTEHHRRSFGPVKRALGLAS